jgi:hypothetical protein
MSSVHNIEDIDIFSFASQENYIYCFETDVSIFSSLIYVQ